MDFDGRGAQINAGGLTAVLRALPRRLPRDPTTPGEILAVLGDRGIALVLLVFSIPAIVPTPGIPAGMVFGAALTIVAMQMAAGWTRIRLPPWLARRRLKRRRVEALTHRAVCWTERLARHVRPRWTGFAAPAAVQLLGVVLIAMGALIALPIPFGNVVPGLAVFLIALGLIERDGVIIALGLVASALALGLTAGLIFGGYWFAEMLLGRPQGM